MEDLVLSALQRKIRRRQFLRHGTASLISGGVLLEACKKKADPAPSPAPTPFDSTHIKDSIQHRKDSIHHADSVHHADSIRQDSIDHPHVQAQLTLTNDDYGILNYAYLLEQLEADFYTNVTTASSFTSIFSLNEQSLLLDIAAHEKAHREFFKAAIPDANRLSILTFRYNNLNFGNRSQVLAIAQTFEDVGVSAYNGIAPSISNTIYLNLASKIISVEARHAASIRGLIGIRNGVDSDIATVNYAQIPIQLRSPIASPGNVPQTQSELGFNIATNNGLEISRQPSAVLSLVSLYINETIINQLP